MHKIIDIKRDRTVIVAADLGEKDFEISLNELKNLIDTAGGDVIEIFTQKREKIDSATYVGSGKLQEVKEYCEENGIDLIVFDGELSPTQMRNIQSDVEMPVLDRTGVILDIFASRAVTSEGKLQVELAQLKYTMPRLKGLGTALSRLGGGIGTRGPGESKLETDRRHIQRKIDHIKQELDEINERNLLTFKRREKNNIKVVALVGYTNVGKSTLLNALTEADVLVENKLFATLDTTTKTLILPEGEKVLLSDTVGFIRKLPTQLIEAFKSTLNQIKYSDLVVIVSDYTDSELHNHIKITKDIISDLGYNGEIVIAYNKCENQSELPKNSKSEVYISAKSNLNLDVFLETIQNNLELRYKKYTLHIPYQDSKTYYEIKKNVTLLSENFDDNEYIIEALIDAQQYKKYNKFIKMC